MKKTKILATALLATALLTGCTSSFVSIDPLNLERVDYPTTDNTKDVAFAISKPQILFKTKISPDLTRGLGSRIQYDANAIACHLTSEINKMLVARGINITDTFESRDDMTFTQKRDTTALFYPVITIELMQQTNTDYQGANPLSTKGIMLVRSDVSMVMLEPLSGEKIWIKQVFDDKEPVTIDYSGMLQTNTSQFQIQDNIAEVAKKIDQLLVDIDDKIIESVNKFVTKEEFRFLNDDIKKLKNIKRY
jgi:hypothetical protein